MSSVVPSGTVPMTASVVESITSMVAAPVEATQAPPMYSLSLTSAFIGSMVIPPRRPGRSGRRASTGVTSLYAPGRDAGRTTPTGPGGPGRHVA